MSKINYNIYPSILDTYSDYLNSDTIWNKYYGNSENPSITPDDFQAKQYQKIIDSINRVPVKWEETEKMDYGTAFNELIDRLIAGDIDTAIAKDKNIYIRPRLSKNVIVTAFVVDYNNRFFDFPMETCKEFMEYFKEAISQVYTEADIETKNSIVHLYGYIDELMPFSIHDIKTTSLYEPWKFLNKWQKVVYPYCINEQGIKIDRFEYNILEKKERKVQGNTEYNYETYTEKYAYEHNDETKQNLADYLDDFIGFLDQNKDKITDKKIFNQV
jgi:hypothetical protein